MNFWSVRNVQKYYNYKSVLTNCQEILCHAALEVLRVHYVKLLKTCTCIYFIGYTKIDVEPVGRWYEALCLRRRHKHSLSQLSSSSSSESEEELEEEANDDSLLLSLDPREWKVSIITLYSINTHFDASTADSF